MKTPNVAPPTVTINDATDVAPTSFNITGKVTAIGTADVTQFGHVLSESNQTPTTADTKTEMGGTNVPKDFKSNFGNLAPGKTYYVRAYALNAVGISYSDVKTVKTGDAQLPTLVSGDGTQVSSTGFVIGGRINSLGTFAVTQSGHCLSESNQNPTTTDTKTELGGATSVPKDFQSNFGNLKANTTYYVRAYATSAAGTAYSDAKTVKTPNVAAPSVTSLDPGSVTINTAVASANITSAGTSGITQYGHCWSSGNQNPTTNDSKTQLGSTAPTKYTSNLTNLSPGTTYYVRAYATSNDGTGYGEVKTFRTQDLQLPTITKPTNPSLIVGATYYNPYFTVENPGNLTITEVGLCYSTGNQTPTINDVRVKDTQTGIGPHNFIYMRDLTPATTYYVRAYAITSAGVGYSPVNSIKTVNLVPPTVTIYPTGTNGYKYTTTSVGLLKSYFLNFTSSSSIVEGNTSVIAYGTCYSTSNQTPTISDAKSTLTDRSGFGGKVITDVVSFGVLAPNLAITQPALYVRIYATTNQGTYYSGVQKYTYAP